MAMAHVRRKWVTGKRIESDMSDNIPMFSPLDDLEAVQVKVGSWVDTNAKSADSPAGIMNNESRKKSGGLETKEMKKYQLELWESPHSVSSDVDAGSDVGANPEVNAGADNGGNAGKLLKLVQQLVGVVEVADKKWSDKLELMEKAFGKAARQMEKARLDMKMALAAQSPPAPIAAAALSKQQCHDIVRRYLPINVCNESAVTFLSHPKVQEVLMDNVITEVSVMQGHKARESHYAKALLSATFSDRVLANLTWGESKFSPCRHWHVMQVPKPVRNLSELLLQRVGDLSLRHRTFRMRAYDLFQLERKKRRDFLEDLFGQDDVTEGERAVFEDRLIFHRQHVKYCFGKEFTIEQHFYVPRNGLEDFRANIEEIKRRPPLVFPPPSVRYGLKLNEIDLPWILGQLDGNVIGSMRQTQTAPKRKAPKRVFNGEKRTSPSHWKIVRGVLVDTASSSSE